MNILWLVLCSVFITESIANGNYYNDFKIYLLSANNRSSEVKWSELFKNETSYETFTSNKTNAYIMVDPAVQSEFFELIENNTLTYEIVNHSVGTTLRHDFETNRNLSKQFPYEGRLGTERYYSHAEINQYIEDLAKQFPSRVSVRTVGKSFEGRLLKTITITNGDGRANKNVILMDGGFHAREWISPAAVLYVIGQLVNNFEANSQLLLDYDWVILPVVNADGYEYTRLSPDNRMWRKTRRPSNEACFGTDLNRNFGFHWNETGSSPDHCSETYAGSKVFSEPEAIVVRDLIHSFADRGKMYLTVHSYGNYILYPWGYIEALPATWRDLDEVGRAGGGAIKAATGTDYKVGCATTLLYAAAGASDDYAFNAGFSTSFTMELPPGGTLYFDPPASEIDRLVKETWVGIEAMARKVIQKYPLKASS